MHVLLRKVSVINKKSQPISDNRVIPIDYLLIGRTVLASKILNNKDVAPLNRHRLIVSFVDNSVIIKLLM